MRRSSPLLLSLLGLLAVWLVPAPVAAAPTCATEWGSLPESNTSVSLAPLSGLRAGRHDCFDRLVFDIAGPVTGYHVGYVEEVAMEASGAPVPLRGGAFLRISVNAPAYDSDGAPTWTPADRGELAGVGDYRTFRQVAWAGSFEGQTAVGLGTRARLPFRVHTLTGPGNGSRVVVDVAHTW